MTEIIFDEIGSYPLPEGVTKEWLAHAFSTREEDEKLFSVINDTFQKKIDAGVQVPNYPQFQDMNQQFLSIINDPECSNGPYDVKEDCARIMELEAIEPAAKKYREEHGEKLGIRVCLTGPLELYLKEFGSTEYTDILNLLAVSVDRFAKKAIESAENFYVKTISIDEPSIGINPQIMFSDSELIEALTTASQSANKLGADVEIHLHSPIHYHLAARTPSINVIGVESAANPDYLELIDKKLLEDTDSYLRVGVARTDVFNLAAILNEKYNINVWKDMDRFEEIISDMETPETVTKRLEKAYDMFGDRVKYAGPDCGLGSWPTQEIASRLLSNVAKGIANFKTNC